jgi:hypothetical protein
VSFSNQSANPITGYGNIFHRCSSIYSSGYDTNSDYIAPTSQQIFWKPEEGFFQIASASMAIANQRPEKITPGAFEFYTSVGTLELPVVYSKIKRQYTSFTLNFQNLPGYYNYLSTLEITYKINSFPVTISTCYEVTGNGLVTVTVPLPVTILTNSFQLNLKMTSYVHRYTPVLRDITLNW